MIFADGSIIVVIHVYTNEKRCSVHDLPYGGYAGMHAVVVNGVG